MSGKKPRINKRSVFDKTHDDYLPTTVNKSGTRYERLAAIVFKSLVENGSVIHDLKLIGESEVKHQIDVMIDNHGRSKRTIIECKDFDLSKDKVGLDIVRSFRSVIEETKPDEAIIVTCNGFTRDAMKFAKKYGIKLVILREFKDEDWNNRIKEIITTIEVRQKSQPSVTTGLASKEDVISFGRQLDQRGLQYNEMLAPDSGVFVFSGEAKTPYKQFIEKYWNEYISDDIGPVRLEYTFSDEYLGFDEATAVRLSFLELRFNNLPPVSYVITSSVNKLAKLIVEWQDTEGDLIVWDDDLRKYTITDKGFAEQVE